MATSKGNDPASNRPKQRHTPIGGMMRTVDVARATPHVAPHRSSRIITTNLAFKQWGNTFPGAACVVALVDRFAQHCHRVEIVGESYRDKHRLDPDRPEPSTSKSRRKRS
jgi:hypothetical protein